MKGNTKLIETLNFLIADELSAVNQYIVHAEMSENWGYRKLHKHFEQRAVEEMKHVGMLISRILFLEGTPIVSSLKKINIGTNLPSQLTNDHVSEQEAIGTYNTAIRFASEIGDSATRMVLEEIVKDEDRHIDEIEALLDQIEQMSLPLFLSTKL